MATTNLRLLGATANSKLPDALRQRVNTLAAQVNKKPAVA